MGVEASATSYTHTHESCCGSSAGERVNDVLITRLVAVCIYSAQPTQKDRLMNVALSAYREDRSYGWRLMSCPSRNPSRGARVAVY